VKSVYLPSADLMLFTVRSGEFEPVIFNKFMLFHAKKEFIGMAMVILLHVPGFGQGFL